MLGWKFEHDIVYLSFIPHSVKDGAIFHDSEELIGGGHVVCNRPLAIPEKSVWCPDFGHHQVVQSQNLNWTLIHQPAIHPRLAKEHVHCVFLNDGWIDNWQNKMSIKRHFETTWFDIDADLTRCTALSYVHTAAHIAYYSFFCPDPIIIYYSLNATSVWTLPGPEVTHILFIFYWKNISLRKLTCIYDKLTEREEKKTSSERKRFKLK